MNTLLGVSTYFSLNWGTASPKAWLAAAAARGYRYVGFADYATLSGLPEMLRLADESPVRLVLGAAFPLADGGTVLAYVETHAGYGNLCQGISEWQDAVAEHPSPRAGGMPALEAEPALGFFREALLTEGLVFITDIPAAWHCLREAGAEIYWRVGPTLAAPPPGIDRESLICAPGSAFIQAKDYEIHRLVRAVGAATRLDAIPTGERYGLDPCPVLTARPGAWLQTPEHYETAFAVYEGATARAEALAERLAGFTPHRGIICPPEPTAGWRGDENALARLRRLAYEGAAIRYSSITDAVRERLESELRLIGDKGFAEYFLVVHDIVNRLAGGDGRARRGRSVTCGRGSGAASLVNYCLGVTNVDVLKHNLMFERFLNEARSDPPDIDVDFAWDERDGILERVFAEYGDDRVGRVANHNRYDWRGALRATARTLGFSDAEITRRLRESPDVQGDPHPGATPLPRAGGEALSMVVRASEKLHALQRGGAPDWESAVRLSEKIVDFPHCLSMHCGGVVLSPGPLARVAPMITSAKGLPTIQWEKDGAEEMGLVKIDLLGNRSLAVIRDAVREVAAMRGISEEAVIEGDPTDDPATRDLVRRGDTFGVFYLESPSMRLLMAKAGVGDFEHAVIHSSIIRPAANAFINEYLRRLRTGKWQSEDPILDELFAESYGIPVYQEDVVKLTMRLCGYEYAKADKVRKCLGKRNAKEVLTGMWPEMQAAALTRGMKPAVIARFWESLMSMTGYSFCKPHSASYAQVSYEAAYLRAHYPASFIAAVLSNGGGYYSTQAYVSEAMRLGLGVLGPDVNASAAKWRAEDTLAVRVGLMAIAGLSRKAMEVVTGQRDAGGAYRGLDDFLRRTGLYADDLRLLALAGALDSLAPGFNRPQLLWYAAQTAREREKAGPSGNGGLLFRQAAGAAKTPPPLPGYTERQRRETEYSLMGFVPDCHPLALFMEEIRAGAEPLRRRKRPLLTRMSRLHLHAGKMVTILAWPISAKVVQTKHRDAMMFQTFEDGESLCETVVFPEEFRRFHRLLGTVQPLWLTGKVLEEFGVASLQIMNAVAVCESSSTLPQLHAS